jgi:outer membrane protein TolC
VETEIVKVLESEVLPAAEAAVELITEGWRAGKFDLFRLIQASREAGEAKRSHLESLGVLWAASIALDRAVGAP